MPKNRGNGTGAGLTPFQGKTFLRTKPRVLVCFWRVHTVFQFARLAQRRWKLAISQLWNIWCSYPGPRELHNKTLLERKVCWIQFTAVWYKPRVSSKTNRRAQLKCNNQVLDKNIDCTSRNYFAWSTKNVLVQRPGVLCGSTRSKDRLTWKLCNKIWFFDEICSEK